MRTRWRFDQMDDATGIFFSRQLEQIRERTYDIKLPNLIARELIPVDHSIATGVDTVTYRQFEQIGLAKIVSDYATDIPRSDVRAKEFTAKIRGILTSYGFSIQEIRAAQQAGVPLDQKKANSARRSVEEQIDRIARSGDADNGLVGFLNNENVSVYTVAAGALGGTAWSGKNGDEIVADMGGIARFIVKLTKGVETPDTLVLPIDQYGDIGTRRIGTVSDMTVLRYFLMNSPYIKNVVPWVWLEGAGAVVDDVATDRMVCYRRDADALQLIISQEFEQFPPQNVGVEVITNCHARCGGVQFFYPLSAAYGDGI